MRVAAAYRDLLGAVTQFERHFAKQVVICRDDLSRPKITCNSFSILIFFCSYYLMTNGKKTHPYPTASPLFTDARH